ncbi:MAG: acyl carrier protein [Planctomycetaceae bacterium]
MINAHQIAGELARFITRQSGPGEPITSHTDLLETQILDSLLMMDLVLHLEAAYGIVMDVDDLSPRHFRSVASLARLIGEKLRTGGTSPTRESKSAAGAAPRDLDCDSLLCCEAKPQSFDPYEG